MNKFDKPYRIAPSFDSRKNIEMFDLASRLDTHEMLQHSLINQISFDIADEEANTLIHIVINVDSRKASQHSKLGVIKFLVNNGANPDKPNKYNQTPLHLACHYQYDLIVEYLLTIDVNANFKDNMGLTPFHYLLTGDIKTIENTGEIMNFIPPPKKVDVKKDDKIIKIKREIYELLKKQLVGEFPIFETFENTIKNILDNDSDFINYRIGLEEKIVKLALDTTPPNYLQEIKNTVDISLKAITKKIEKLFNNLPELNEFQIHSTEKNSWAHPTNTQPLSLIKNGNTKNRIKDEVNKASDNILQLQNNFRPYDFNITSYEEDGLNEIMGLYFSLIKNKFPKIKGVTILEYKGDFDSSDFKIIDNINEQIKHVNAFDNASSIMDFPNLKYAGGPRGLKLELPETAPTVFQSPIQIVKNLSQMSINKQILYMLSSPLTTTNIDLIVTGATGPIDFFKIDTAMYNTYFKSDLDDPSKWTQMRKVTSKVPLNRNIKFAVLCYIIFAKTAISNPERFEELSKVSYLHTIPGTPPTTAFFQDNPVVIKWFNMFMDGINVASFIYGMWCDLTCYFSPSNLDGIGPLNLVILVSALANNTISLDQSIYNSYKPHLVYDICNGALSNEEKIASVTMLLLNENCTNLYFNNIDNDYTTLIGIKNDIDKNVLLIGKLVLTYLQNIGTSTSAFNPSVSTEEGKLYLIYNKSGKKPINILVNIILEFYGKMINKPLKQTIIDFIYLLISYDPNTTITINDFKKMSIYEITIPTLISNLSVNLIPSHYGLENVVIDSPKFSNSKPTNLVFNHFQIAHVLGLYFEGMCNPHQNFSLDYFFTINNIDFSIVPSNPTGPNEHTFNTTQYKIDDNQLPLPFNNVVMKNLPNGAKVKYYNVNNREIVNPSIHSYFTMVVKRIQLYQNKIAELLKDVRLYIDQLVKGKTTNLSSLITNLYPTIVSYCKIINSYNESYERINKNYANNNIWKNSPLRKKFTSLDNYSYTDLAKNINTINASFYLYYYVLAPDKLIKLSKFNYYQIPITSPNKYLFYTGTGDENVYDTVEPSSTGFGSSSKIGDIVTDVTTHTDKLNSGFVAQFSIGNYASFYNEYKTNNFNTVSVVKGADFVFNKKNKLPPSLFNNLEQFYKFCLIELVIKIIIEIDNGKNAVYKDLYEKLEEIVKSSGIKVDNYNYEISAYHILSKIIQEIVREQFAIYVNNEVNEVFNRDIMKNSTITPISSGLFTKKEMTISLDKTNVDYEKIKDIKEIKNLYNLLVQPTKSDVFILYPNDLTNTSRLKIKSGVTINDKIIDLLLLKRGSPYHTNLEGLTPVYGLIKNYNFEPIQSLKKLGIDFRMFEGESPIDFITRELNNNLDKTISGLVSGNKSNKDLLSNFDNYLYNDVKTLITSNEVYGNNILAYLPMSFNMSTYIVLQYLLENLINTDDKFTLDNLVEFLAFINVDINDINKNYLGENLSIFNIPNDMDIHIANEFIKEKTSQKVLLEAKKIIIDDSIAKLKISNRSLATKMELSSKYKTVDDNIKKYTQYITDLNSLISMTSSSLNLPNNPVTNEYKIINRYRKLSQSNVHNVLIMSGWEQLLNKDYTKDNYNLGLIQLLLKQKQLIQKLNINNLKELRKMQSPLKKLSDIGEEYFSNHKFIESNKIAHFVRDMLEYLTEITICTGLELVIRRILHTFFSNNSPNDSYTDINNRIEYILSSESYGMNKSLLQILKNDIAPELAKNASEIFDNQADEQGHVVRPVRDILISFFQNLENSPIKLPGEIITIFIKDVVSYFDTFASRAILLWQVNAENILKYFINNYRCVETLLSL